MFQPEGKTIQKMLKNAEDPKNKNGSPFLLKTVRTLLSRTIVIELNSIGKQYKVHGISMILRLETIYSIALIAMKIS